MNVFDWDYHVATEKSYSKAFSTIWGGGGGKNNEGHKDHLKKRQLNGDVTLIAYTPTDDN